MRVPRSRPADTREALALLLRPGNAGSNAVADHIRVTQKALTQLPGRNGRPGKKVLIRASGGGTHRSVAWLHERRLSYSISYTLPFDAPEHYRQIPKWSGIPPTTTTGSRARVRMSPSPPPPTSPPGWDCSRIPKHKRAGWEPKRLRFRLFTIPAAIARTARTVTLHLFERGPRANLAAAAIQRLRALPGPAG